MDTLSILVLLTLMLCSQACNDSRTNPASERKSIVIGLNPSERSDNVQRNAQFLAGKISERIGMPVEIFVAQDYNGLVEAMRAQRIDFAFLAPVSYVFAENIADAQVLLKAERHGNPFYYGCIVVRADSPFTKIEDLRGKDIAWVDPTSASGHIFPKAALIERGIDPEKFFGRQTFAGGHDAVLLSVVNGTITAGATYANDTNGIDGAWTQLLKGDSKNIIRPIFYSPPIPGDNLSTTKHFNDTHPDIVKRVTDAVQKLSEDSLGMQTLQELYHVDAMIPAVSADYDPVRRYAAILKLDISGHIQKSGTTDSKSDSRNTLYSWIMVGVLALIALGWMGRDVLAHTKTRKRMGAPAHATTPHQQMDTPIQFDVRELNVRFHKGTEQETSALKDVTLRIRAGEFIAVIGPSGAGKTTLLRCLNRTVDATSGAIYFDGENVTTIKGKPMMKFRRGIAFIFQHFNLIGTIAVLSNVLTGRLAYTSVVRSLFGWYAKRDIEIATMCVNNVGLADKMNARTDTLSGGQLQRVAIARAIAQQPKVILADEPMSSLDPKLAEVVLDVLQKINREHGITVIVNLHVLDLAKQYAKRIVGLRAGSIVFDGTPDELTTEVSSRIYNVST